jgi:hypothetical protein
MRALPFIAPLALVGAAFAQPAQAQELNRGTQRIEVLGTASSACVAGSVQASGVQVNATYVSGGANDGSVTIPVLVDPNTAATLGSRIVLNLPVVCNTSHNISVRSFYGALTRDGANNRPTGGFSESQAYSIDVTWQAQTARLETANRTVGFVVPRPAKGDVTVDINVPRGTRPLVAGAYRDAVVVEIRPNN